MADSDQQRSDRNSVRIPWQVIMWLATIIFFAGVMFTTWQERSYVDSKDNEVKALLTEIRVEQAKILEQLKQMDKPRR